MEAIEMQLVSGPFESISFSFSRNSLNCSITHEKVSDEVNRHNYMVFSTFALVDCKYDKL